MIQTDSGKYAIRAVICLAARQDPTVPVSAFEVAAAENIPPHYLAKVMKELALAGVLESVRGRGGGFRLGRPPEKIRVIEILRAVEDVGRIETECILGLDACHDEAACPMHTTWKSYRERLLRLLTDLTVVDLLESALEKRLQKVGGGPPS